MDRAASRQPWAGNAVDKYGSTSPVIRRVMASFFRDLDELWALAAPTSVLDVGCGEGIVTRTWARRLSTGAVTGVDRAESGLSSLWKADPNPSGARFVVADAHALPFADGSFDLVASIEAVMQFERPRVALAELVRVAGRHVLVSVPREPLWQLLNVASGRHVRALGNSPGTLHHWSTRAFVALVAEFATVVAVRTPTPWTQVLARV